MRSKIAIVLRDDLLAWQRLNVTAFLSSGIAAAYPEAIGKPYEDADGTEYLSLFVQPVMVYEADAAAIRTVHERCLRRELTAGVFTADMFRTGNDDDNRAVVRDVRTADLDLVGVAVRGPRNAVDKVTKGCAMHP